MSNATPDTPAVAARRKAAKRTALWMGVIAVLIYAGFIAMGAFGQ